MSRKSANGLVIAVYPSGRGYAFAIFYGPRDLFDWGMREVRGPKKNEAVLAGIRKLIDRYTPEAVLIEDATDPSSRRSARIKRLHGSIAHLAEAKSIKVCSISRDAIRSHFASSGAKTKYEIALAIAQHMPAMAHWLPPERKIWMGEDHRQNIFDAISLALVYYGGEESGKQIHSTSTP